MNNIGDLSALSSTLNDNFAQIKSNQDQLENKLNRYSDKFWQSHITLAGSDGEQKRKLFEIEQQLTKLSISIESIDTTLLIASKYATLIESTNSDLVREISSLNSHIVDYQLRNTGHGIANNGSNLVSFQKQ